MYSLDGGQESVDLDNRDISKTSGPPPTGRTKDRKPIPELKESQSLSLLGERPKPFPPEVTTYLISISQAFVTL